MRARLKRRERRRRVLLLTVVVVVLAVAGVAAYLLTTTQSPVERLVGTPVSSSVYQKLYSFAHSSYGSPNSSLMSQVKSYGGQPLMAGGKPVVVYIGADYCPYCAFQRWSIIVAMMRFGNFSNLHYMLSSPTDIFPNSPTFTFYGSSYTSDYVAFQSYEQEDRAQKPLQSVPLNYTSVFRQFGSAYPFLNFGNRYVVDGAFYYPTLLDGKNWTQITQLLGGNNDLSNQVVEASNAITATVCKLTGGNPSSVCGNVSIARLTATLVAYGQSSSASLNAGIPSAMPAMWATVQYGQIAWTTNNSTKIRYPANTTATAQSGMSE